MIHVHVTYTINQGFAAQNKRNIGVFLEDFKKLNSADFSYEVFTHANGLTFLHISTYKNAAIQKQVLNVPSFLAFQKARDESGLDGSHKVEVLKFVGKAGALI